MNVGECSGDCNLDLAVNCLYVHQMIILGAHIAFSGIRAQMLSCGNSLDVKTPCGYSARLDDCYLLFQTGERPPLVGAESFHSAAVFLREHSDL